MNQERKFCNTVLFEIMKKEGIKCIGWNVWDVHKVSGTKGKNCDDSRQNHIAQITADGHGKNEF